MHILGLACATSQHHAAALLRDGEIVGAVEEERFVRRKGYGYSRCGHPQANLMNCPDLALDEVMPTHSVDWLLAKAGLRFEDLDAIAVNAIPAKFRDTYSHRDRARAPRTIVEGRYVFVPHHLAHAASSYRVSGFADANILTVDGRGERETACSFVARQGRLERQIEVFVGDGGSIGGAYETITRILGFGPFGQGSTMALAAYGRPRFDLRSSFALEGHQRANLHERRLWQEHVGHSRDRGGPLGDNHRDLAASAQVALEHCVLSFAKEALALSGPGPLCLAGGVALNCVANTRLTDLPAVTDQFVLPAAHDAGTALGAALEASYHLGVPPPRRQLRSAALGPSYDDDACAQACARARLRPVRHDDIAAEVAARLADGRVVAWFDGALEMGPRALGQRSLLADPRRPEMARRINEMKGRELWRPFAPSILVGHEQDWFEDAFVSPFMLFGFSMRGQRRAQVPAVVHVDGTTRPQSVDPHVLPRFARVLEAFHELTGVPLVLNTSFNGHGEPLVCSPEQAIDCFGRLGADALVLGNLLVERDVSEAFGKSV